jgi:hypothetical protein
MEERKRRGGIVGPVVLIGVGVIFLLNNLGGVDWSIWQAIWRLWPVLLIAVGLDILIGRHSVLGSLVVLVLTVGLLAGGVWLLNVDLGVGQAAISETVRQSREGATRAQVVIEPGVGRLHIKTLPESANLVEGKIDLGKGERAMPNFSVKGDRATFTLQTDRHSFGPTFWGGDGRRTWDLGFAPEVPLDLQVDLGMGEADLDLTGLAVSSLDVSVAMGKTTVLLPREGDIKAKIDGAMGEIVVVVPEGVEARVHANVGIGSRKLPDGYQRQDEVYTSPGYARADNRVDLKVSLAIGSIQVRGAE